MERRWWALFGVALAVFAVGLDGTILTIALPTLAGALKASGSDLVWFSSAYLLALAAAMLPAGVLGDRYGRKRVLLGSLALFGVASVLCATATSPAMFVAARALAGLAGAGIIVMALAALTVLFTEAERPRAVGIWAAVNFLSLPLGPLLGGWLLTHYWWGWVFLLNVPVVVVGLVIGWRLVPESRSQQRLPVDLVGIATFTAGMIALVYGFVNAGQRGWLAGSTTLWVLAGLIALGAFAWYEATLSSRADGHPLVDGTLFRIPSFRWGTVLAALTSMALIGVLFTTPQYFQGVLGLSAVASGVRLLPLIAGLVVGAGAADTAVKAIGARPVLTAGFVILAVGFAAGARTTASSGAAFVVAWMAVVGLGLGLCLSTTSSAALSQLPQERSGVGSAVMQALQEVGSPLGAAVLGGISLGAYRAHLQIADVPPSLVNKVRAGIFDGRAVADHLHSDSLRLAVGRAFVHGMSSALLMSAAVAVVGAALALAFFPPTALRPVPPDVADQPPDVILAGGRERRED